ncbi:MAG: sialidase family protein [Chloroflexota bacterium]
MRVLRTRRVFGIPLGILASIAVIGGTLAAGNVRLTNDVGGGYISAYTMATGIPYTDNTLDECGVARGRQNEPAVEMDPRNANVLIGSSNDYCGVYQPPGSATPSPVGPIWLGYYRSENGGSSFQSSLVPGYPDDKSPYAALAHIRTASSGDPVIAWDAHGRVYMGSESSDDPAGTKKTFGDVWVGVYDNPNGPNGATVNDGKRFVRSEIVKRGSSAPNLLGVFNDKTAIEADRTGGRCDGYVYFSWSRFTGNGTNNIYISRSIDHGATWSTAKSLTPVAQDVQFPDISVTANGHVYVTFRQFERRNGQVNAVDIVKSTDCGATFGAAKVLQGFTPYDASDVADPQPTPAGNPADAPFGEAAASGNARDCGDFAAHCQSGYTFFRRDTQVRSTADQTDIGNEYVYIVYDPSKPGTQVPTLTTYGSIGHGTGSQSGIYFLRYNGATGQKTAPAALIDPQGVGHQLFPDISAGGGGVLHTLWWDSRNDPTYSRTRPIGNDAAGNTFASLDVFGAMSTNGGSTWTSSTAPLTTVRSNPNYEQFGGRTVPFAGDYLWVTSHGTTAFGVWTDWRDTVQGPDPREGTANEDEDNGSADVLQCRTFTAAGGWSGDTCPHLGGIDQNIYGGTTP